jgi:hypothetical protein
MNFKTEMLKETQNLPPFKTNEAFICWEISPESIVGNFEKLKEHLA